MIITIMIMMIIIIIIIIIISLWLLVRLWYSKEKDVAKHKKGIRSSYCDRDSKDLHARICANPQKRALWLNRIIDLSD